MFYVVPSHMQKTIHITILFSAFFSVNILYYKSNEWIEYMDGMLDGYYISNL